MFSTQSNYGFASSYPKPYTFNENMLCSYTQGYLGVHPSVLGCWYAPARSSEVGPWAWQWNERIRTQEVRDKFPPLQPNVLNEPVSAGPYPPPPIHGERLATTGPAYQCCGPSAVGLLPGSRKASPQHRQARDHLPTANSSTPEVDRHDWVG
jgi:hypothetical protein